MSYPYRELAILKRNRMFSERSNYQYGLNSVNSEKVNSQRINSPNFDNDGELSRQFLRQNVERIVNYIMARIELKSGKGT